MLSSRERHESWLVGIRAEDELRARHGVLDSLWKYNGFEKVLHQLAIRWENCDDLEIFTVQE